MRKSNSSFQQTGDCRATAQAVGLACSHLGKNSNRLTQVAFLLRQLFNSDWIKNTRLLVGEGTAIAPWATRAAELWQIPIEIICVMAQPGLSHASRHVDKPPTPTSKSQWVHRTWVTLPNDTNIDQFVIHRVPRLFIPYVRRNGRIEAIAANRLTSDSTFAVHVAPSRSAKHLISKGGIPLSANILGDSAAANVKIPSKTASTKGKQRNRFNWSVPKGLLNRQWLIHCTRGNQGSWPEESEEHYYESILKDPPSACCREAIDALHRIVTQKRIIAQASTSRHAYPVVCFSEEKLDQLLARRCYRSHLHRWDYEPYGIAITRSAAEKFGIRPVIYCPQKRRREYAEQDQYRIHPIGKTYNWREEKEWRSPDSVPLEKLSIDEVCIFAEDSVASRSRLAGCGFVVHFLKRSVN